MASEIITLVLLVALVYLAVAMFVPGPPSSWWLPWRRGGG